MPLVNGLKFDNLRGDFYGGLTAAVVALPLALAMGVASGAGPVAGVYGAILVGFFAAIFGGTPAQVSGPTGPMTVVMAAIFTQYTGLFPDDPAHGVALAFTVVIMGGLFQVLFGLLRVGKFIELVPHPVVSGFMSGIGVIIILLQLPPLLGYAAQPGALSSVMALPEAFRQLVPQALMLGAITLVIVYLMPARLNRIMPSPLVALIVGTLIYLLFLTGSDVLTLGEIPTGLPRPTLPTYDLELLPEMIQSALTLAALGSIDSLLTSLVADNLTRTYHDSDRELIGQGIGNTIAGFFGGLPGAGATMRTVVNIKAGGKTPISGALHAVVLLLIILGAGSVASHIPNAVLAGILIKVGTDIIDWDYLKRVPVAPRAGVIMMLVVLLMTVFVDLIMAVAVGMAMAGMVFMKRMVDLQLESIHAIREVDEDTPLTPEEARIIEAARGRILLFHLGGPMSFGAAKGIVRNLARFDEYDVLVLELTDVPQIDFTATRALYDIVHDAREVGREVILVGCRPQVCQMLKKLEVTDQVPDDHLVEQRLEALRLAQSLLEGRNRNE
ncbi:MAG: sodium-independent anion transporter [Gammaproteobacteria bacterium]|nr:MAG: sodium-independent anion transporter [Gammaproteobacteria bacterium]RTZ75487.1 MAG: sodium-independent anion transporter [Gammaproteobacteria bacterium]